MLMACLALSSVAAYDYAGARTYESYDRTYDYTINENRDSSSSSTYGISNRGIASNGYTNSYSNSYSKTEHFSESIRSDTYTRQDYGRYGNYNIGLNYGSRYDSNYRIYSGNYPRSRYYYGPSNRYNYDPFGYYQARPSYSWVY